MFITKKKFLAVVISLVYSLSILAFPSKTLAIGDPVRITNNTNATVFPQTVADSKGYLHMVWMEVINENERWSNIQNPGIFYSRWNGDTWSTPLKISENTGFAEIPAITVDATDTVHVVWDDETYGGGLSRVAYKSRSSSGTWSAIETLPVPSGTVVNWNARVATDNSNVPHVAFSAISPGFTDSTLYWTRKVSGAWTTPELVSKDAAGNNLSFGCQWSDLRQNSSGTNIYLIYWCWPNGIHYRSYSSGTWSTPFQITNAGNIEYTRMVTTPGGEVFVTWFQSSDTSVRVRWTQSSVWQAETTLTNSATRSTWFFPIMGITSDSKERAHVGWGERDGGGLIDLRYRSFILGSGWQSTQDVDLNNNDADTPTVYPDKWDNQHFSWTEKDPTSGQWDIYYRVAEGTIQTVSGTSGGTITANPGGTTYTTLSIPANALSQDTQIGIQIGPVPESVDPLQVTIPRAFTFRPHGLLFINNKTGTATVFYTDAEVAGVDERKLKVWVWNSQTNLWEAKANKNTPIQNKIEINLTGFSLYGISAPVVNVNWNSPNKDEEIKKQALLFQFQLNYLDGTEVVDPQSPDELRVELKNKEGNIIKTYLFEPSGIVKEEGKGRYMGTITFKKDGVEPGEYKLEVYIAGNLVGVQTFKFLE